MAATWNVPVWVFVAVVCLVLECHGGKQKPTWSGSSSGVGSIFKLDKKLANRYAKSDLGRSLRVSKHRCSMECQMNDKCKSFFYHDKKGCELGTRKYETSDTKKSSGWNYFVKKI